MQLLDPQCEVGQVLAEEVRQGTRSKHERVQLGPEVLRGNRLIFIPPTRIVSIPPESDIVSGKVARTACACESGS